MSKILTISDNREFSLIYKEGKKWYCEGAVLFFLLGNEKKMAVVASKKVGNAVLRNKSKRLLREIFRILKDELLNGSYVLVARPQIRELSFLKLEKNLRWGFKKLGCLN